MSVRRTVALALSATLALTGLTTAVSPAAAAADTAPYAVTIAPLTDPSKPSDGTVESVGTGVQISDDGYQTRWHSLSDGSVAHAPFCDSYRTFSTGDTSVCVDASDSALVHDFATGATAARWLARGGDALLPVVAGGRLVQAEPGGDGVTLALLGYGENAPADLRVLLPGAASQPLLLAQDGDDVLLSYLVGGAETAVLLDLATGALTPLPVPSGATQIRWGALDAGRVVLAGGTKPSEVVVFSRADLTAPGRKVTLPQAVAATPARFALVGDWLVVQAALPVAADGSEYASLRAVPLAGGEARDLGVTVRAGDRIMPGPGGVAYVTGRAGSGPWEVRRVAAGAEGAPVVTRALSAGAPFARENVTLSQGRVVAKTAAPGGKALLQGYDLATTGTHAAAATWSCDPASTAAVCPPTRKSGTYGRPWTDTGDGRLVVLDAVSRAASDTQTACTDCVVVAHVTTPGTGGATRSTTIRASYAMEPVHLVGASGRYVHFLAYAAGATHSIVADIETGAVLRDSTNENQALWGGQLWTMSATDGKVTAVDVRTGATVATADLGTSCRFSALEVVGKWISARCAGDARSVVIHDREKRTSVWIRVTYEPLHLGDGFVAYQVLGGESMLYAEGVQSGESEWHELGALPYDGDDHDGRWWTVDRFGGGVAFVDRSQAVRVTGLGGVTSRLTAIDADTPAANIKSGAWKPRWWLSKPGASWTLTLRNKVSGKTVRTLTGGEARGIVAPSWDGKDAAGKYVANGAYTWSLTVKPADGQGADLTASGNVAVSGAGAVWRDMAGDDGFGDVLAMDTAGAVSLYRGTGTGGVSSRIAGSGNKFATGSLFVPVGDLNGDRCADVYVRVGSELRAYRPGCGKAVTASSPYTLVGSGWSGYDVLTSPGDVNGDGYADLIARQASTGDVYFYGGTASHVLKARVKIAADWRLYKRIVGAGDLNGDGRGDLLGVDAAGVLWRYFGTSTGGVAPRVKVGGGWGVYSALVGVGDLSGDGRADLLARTTDGKLYRYSSTGTGAYGGRVLIGTGGWNGFKGLF
ncbi:FG-GAP-like repeat-containing protein [Streptomyces hydrogenans]|uniref:FG-GAP-like repeat-containing protein n=1 Tax=Streptomyces hydrogenans TaxID=1873719 RepID=UPI00369851FA